MFGHRSPYGRIRPMENVHMHISRWENNSKNHFEQSYNYLFNLCNDMWETNMIHFSKLNLNSEPIAFHLGFTFDNHYYFYKPAYNIKFSKFSPGKVHIMELMELVYKNGCKEFDFLYTSLTPYKTKLLSSLIQ